MKFRYGNYTHASGECTLRVVPRTIFSDSNLVIGLNVRYEITGRLHADSVSALTAAMLAMERAYSVSGQACGLYEDDGTPTAHVLPASMAPMVIQPPAWGGNTPGEYTTYRDYTIIIEAARQLETGLDAEVHESISYLNGWNGGPVYKWFDLLQGPPQRQIVKQQTTYKVLQTGARVSTSWWPEPNAPKWPAYMHIEQCSVTYGDPEKMRTGTGTTFYKFRTEWNWVFESDVKLTGYPSI